MNKREIAKLTKEINASSGLQVTGTRMYGKGDYSLDVVDTLSGYSFVIHSVSKWNAIKEECAHYLETADCYES